MIFVTNKSSDRYIFTPKYTRYVTARPRSQIGILLRETLCSVFDILSVLSKPTCNEEHIWLSELAQKILQSLQFSSSWRGFSLLWNLCDKWGFGLAYEENTWFTLSLPCLTIFQQNITPFSKNIHYRCILPCTFLPTEFLQWFLSFLWFLF